MNNILEFAAAYSGEEPPLLEELRRRSYQRTLHGRMVSGAHQGRLLALLSKLVRPQRALEIGTFTGYGTLCLAEGLAEGGTIDTIEPNDELYALQREFWGRSDYSERINLLAGKALPFLEGMEVDGRYELVFVDGDKTKTPDYVEHAWRLLSDGGLLIVDNVWWGGAGDPRNSEFPSDEARVLAHLNTQLQSDPRWETVVLPLRDGLTLCRKISA
ncbi:MAG: O-methyltransferase [Flavobacteriales bacterium]|nr:O-methyltransferase [Flavobacteriales bacterium]